MALAIGGAPCGILPESVGLLRLFGWSRRSWIRRRPSPSHWCGSGGDGGSLPADGDGACLDDGPTRTPSSRAIQALFGCCDRLMVAAAAAQVLALVVYVQLFSVTINSLMVTCYLNRQAGVRSVFTSE